MEEIHNNIINQHHKEKGPSATIYGLGRDGTFEAPGP